MAGAVEKGDGPKNFTMIKFDMKLKRTAINDFNLHFFNEIEIICRVAVT